MSVEANKALVNRMIDVWNQHDAYTLRTMVSPDYVLHTSSGTDVSFEELREGWANFLAAFPDLQYTVPPYDC